MPLSDIVVVNISTQNPGVTRAGFGVQMILSQNATWAERSRRYTEPDGVLADWAATTPEYVAASKVFAQSPRPTSLRIGRANTNPVTQRWGVAVALASVGKTYTVRVSTADGTKQTASYVAAAANEAAVLTSAVGPFDLRGLASPYLRVAFNAGGDQDFDITASAATKAGAAAAFAWTGNFTFKVNGGPLQTITGAGTASAAALAVLINATAFDCRAVVNGANVDLVSDRQGTGASVQIVSVTDTIGNCGFTAGTATGAGTVANAGAVTAAELALIMAAITNGTATAVGGALVLTSTTTGSAGTATCKAASTADTAMGGQFATNVVVTGSDVGGATNDEIMQGLKDLIDAFATPTMPITTSLQGSVGSKTLRLLANATTDWFAVEIDDPSLLSVAQDHAAPTGGGLATDLAAILSETADWYGVVTLYNSSAYVLATAAWVESNQKLYTPATNDTASATTADTGATDVLHMLKANSYARSGGFFHQRAEQFADAAEMGRFFPINPGGDNWRLKTLAGVTAGWSNGQQLTATQITNLNDRRANYYYILGGTSVIGGDGKVAANEYIDVVRGRDWWVARTQERLANLLIQNEKIPFTDAGIGLVEAQVRAQNDEGIAAGLINPGSPPEIPAPTVTVPRSGQVSQADRQARQLNNVNTVWTLAGAINKLTVNATITA